MANQGTPYHPFSIAVENGFYVIKQPLNNNLQLDIPVDEFVVETHPTQAEWVYFKRQAFDRTLCTTFTGTDRDNFVDLVIDLALPVPTAVAIIASVPLSAAIIASVPLTVSNLPFTGESFAHNVTSTVTSLTDVQGYRVNPASTGIARVHIRQVNAASSGLSSFATVTIQSGQTITGGTWNTITGTNLQSNTLAGAVVSGTAVARFWGDFRNSESWHLAEGMTLSIPIGTNFIVQFSNGGVGSGGVSIGITSIRPSATSTNGFRKQ